MFILFIYFLSQCLISTGGLWSLDGLVRAVILTGNHLSLWQTWIIFLSPIWWSSHQAACQHMLWWWWSHPMGSTLHFLSLPYGCYPPPQHVARSPDHLVDTNHWWYQLPATQWAHVWFMETPSANIQWTWNLCYFSCWLCNKVPTICSRWTTFLYSPTPIKWIQKVLDQLHSVQMSFCHIEFVVQDLQRMWLHVWGILNYMEIYKPCMNGHAPPGKGVADTIGTLTTSIRVAQDMFLAGLPCWLIWESKTFGDEKIFMIAEVLHLKDHIILDPHKFNYPIIYKGPASGLKKFSVIEKSACNFLCSQNPFAIMSTPSSLAEASTSSTPAVASSSATQHLTGQNSWGAIHRSEGMWGW